MEFAALPVAGRLVAWHIGRSRIWTHGGARMLWVDAAVVATFEPAPGLYAAAVWDGGEWCHVHALDGGKFGPRLESWDMIDPATGEPAIRCTPDALRELVEYRLEQPGAVRAIAAGVADYAHATEPRPRVRRGVALFSVN